MSEINCVLKRRGTNDYVVVIKEPDKDTKDKVLSRGSVDEDVFYTLGLYPREEFIIQDEDIVLGTANRELSSEELLCIANQIKTRIGTLQIH